MQSLVNSSKIFHPSSCPPSTFKNVAKGTALVATIITVAIAALSFTTATFASFPPALPIALCSLGAVVVLTSLLFLIIKGRSNNAAENASKTTQKTQPKISKFVLLTAPEKKQMKEVILRDWEEIMDRNPTVNIPVFHAGKHMGVIEHADYPKRVIKLPSIEHANAMLSCLKMCEGVVKKHQLDCCIIPPTEVISLEGTAQPTHGLFIMKKVNGKAANDAKEASEIAFEKFTSAPESKARWQKMFQQAAEFICLTGYWDTSWSNILLLPNEKGFGFIDFEHVTPDPNNIACGINRLFEMAPPDFFNSIEEIASKYHVYLEPRFQDLEAAKQKRGSELALSSKIRAWHTAKGIVQGNQKVDETQWADSSLERKIVNKFNKDIEKNSNFQYYAGSLIEQRKVHWQPFCFDINESRADFESALHNLQKANVLCDWTIEKMASEKTDIFKIYF